jgi:hypothetical protein
MLKGRLRKEWPLMEPARVAMKKLNRRFFNGC